MFFIDNTNERYYIFNLETTKIELHFDKAEYMALPEESKTAIKGAFLFSRHNGGCWVSRAKEPNLWRAREVAKSLGFVAEKRQGERITYAEQLDRKADRAEARAERFEGYADNAERRGESLQEGLARHRGDIAFFTQPIIAGHSGSQSFANYRQRLYDRYERGFEEYRKSEYFRDRAATARDTASNYKLDDKGYVNRKIEECRKEIKKRQSNIDSYEKSLARITGGEELRRYNNTIITAEELTEAMARELELIEVAIDKQGFFENRLDELGGVPYSKENINVGDIVEIERWGECEVTSRGPKNIFYRILHGGAKGCGGKVSYAEIIAVVNSQV